MKNLTVIEQDSHSMADAVRLEVRIAQLAKPVSMLAPGFRRLSGTNPESLLAALLLEMDETVLPRVFKVITDSGQSAFLNVANRRLLQIDRSGGQFGSLEPPFDNAESLVDQLRHIFAGATKAGLRSSRAASADTLFDVGFTLSTLAAAGSVDFGDLPDPDPVPAFFSALVDCMIAWVKLDPTGHSGEQGGDPDRCRRLESLAREGLADIDAQLIHSLENPDHPGCILLNSGGGSVALIYARSKNAGFLAILPSKELPAFHSTWRSFF